MSRSVTIREFAEELHISERLAYGMARCEDFQRLGISFDVGLKRPGKKNAMWRMDLERYYAAREKRLV